jgi:tRNA dimethylallyltransferase
VERRLIVIAGPTAVGKTELAVRLAEYLKTEIISADSRQIFRELNIGTAKPSPIQLGRVRHHFINSHSINENFDAGQFGRDATRLIGELFKRYNDLILCGGSGLYIRAVCDGFDEMPEVSPEIRMRIIGQYQKSGLSWLQAEVAERDPDYFAQVDRQNPQRLMRALEILEVSNKTLGEWRKKTQTKHSFKIVKIGLELDRQQLYARIDIRMNQMIEDGLFEEAEKFYPQRHINALQTVGYREIFDFMSGEYDRDEAIRLLKRNTRHYAKRQLTWFKKDSEMIWFNASDSDRLLTEIKSHLEK